MANTSCLLGTYYYRGTATLPDDYDYKDSIERSKKKFQMNILSTDVLVNIKDIKLCTEKLVRRSITLCVEMEKDFREHYRKGYIKDKHINDNHTRKEILEDIFIPFFFNRIECKTKQFYRRHDNFTDISWFPTKKTQVREIAKRHTRQKTVDSEFHYYTKEIMETYYPEIYQFYKDMTKWDIKTIPYIGMTAVRCKENGQLTIPPLKLDKFEGIFYNGREETMGKFTEIHKKHIRTYFECGDVEESEKIPKFLICVVNFLNDLFDEIEEIDETCGFGTESYVLMTDHVLKLRTKQDKKIEDSINFDLLRFPPLN